MRVHRVWAKAESPWLLLVDDLRKNPVSSKSLSVLWWSVGSVSVIWPSTAVGWIHSPVFVSVNTSATVRVHYVHELRIRVRGIWVRDLSEHSRGLETCWWFEKTPCSPRLWAEDESPWCEREQPRVGDWMWVTGMLLCWVQPISLIHWPLPPFGPGVDSQGWSVRDSHKQWS